MIYRNHIHVNFRILFNLLVLLIFTVAWAIPVSAQSTDPDASEESRTYPIHAAHLNPGDSGWNGVISTQFITVGTDITTINLPHYIGGSGTLTYSITDNHDHSASPGDTNSLTSGISAASSTRSDLESALEFSTHYSF